ncbi:MULTISPECIES: TraR/DksA C4-type zinc finger protein [Lonsdalea]|uniref:Conjugal transfer protein TraR n=2 Tax=Lonsdalea TaxID=1082702 RepID=A0ACD1J8Z4_9GAMM|nr:MULTISPECIES: TraR/DksA C4-type zinc finger protein [Lonsdalea]RAT11118.1 conjugal transfer protein TraR [Lonsdalea quercina]RAT19073.1 conjugal transfer protein TraR [Lonsdalea populi]RAT21000.1 conjugal transfer protein TraR [Lonsdalea populi]RAT23487.1 conjugal transfer protein TraR [Lonsdalea populi]RAT30804.1 conjugal transfer protein TraR [Lonsdalea populi]
MFDDLNDEMAQASTALFIQRGIDAIRAQVQCARPSKEFCECCGADIPLERQRAVPGVELCAGCQDVKEKQKRHHFSVGRGD